ncbi:kinetochore-associated Ndc80 complex subunit spc25 [Mortierella sp. GBA30]|nr:kinetochore-associated Ndc80 complex subunit spc25 [Mortierella sp. GBA30]
MTSTAATAAAGTTTGSGSSSVEAALRSSTGGRSSMADASSHRLSIGNKRLSLLPVKSSNALTSILPTPQFDSEELHAQATAFTNEFNSYTQKIKTKITETSDQWDRETAELQEHDRELREDLKAALSQEIALAKALNREKEEAHNMSKIIQQLSARKDEMRQMQSSLESQVTLLRKEVKAKREGMMENTEYKLARCLLYSCSSIQHLALRYQHTAKIAQKKALDEQILKNKPEVSSYESILAMRIVGVQEDQIGFVFTRINELDWEQEYSVTVDVSQYDYSVSECSPSLPELPSLVRYLNDTRDLYGFLKRVRKGFKDLCKK